MEWLTFWPRMGDSRLEELFIADGEELLDGFILEDLLVSLTHRHVLDGGEIVPALHCCVGDEAEDGVTRGGVRTNIGCDLEPIAIITAPALIDAAQQGLHAAVMPRVFRPPAGRQRERHVSVEVQSALPVDELAGIFPVIAGVGQPRELLEPEAAK